jgi:hypothetical protein
VAVGLQRKKVEDDYSDINPHPARALRLKSRPRNVRDSKGAERFVRELIGEVGRVGRWRGPGFE